MRIVQTIKPQIYKGYSKEDLKMKIGLYGWSMISSGNFNFSGWTSLDEKYKYGVNFEKRNRKTKVLKSGKRKVIQEKHWIAYVYKFKKDYPISIKQESRYFDFSLYRRL